MAPRQPGGGLLVGVPYGGRTATGVDSSQVPGPREYPRGHLGRRCPHPGARSSSPPSICRTPA